MRPAPCVCATGRARPWGDMTGEPIPALGDCGAGAIILRAGHRSHPEISQSRGEPVRTSGRMPCAPWCPCSSSRSRSPSAGSRSARRPRGRRRPRSPLRPCAGSRWRGTSTRRSGSTWRRPAMTAPGDAARAALARGSRGGEWGSADGCGSRGSRPNRDHSLRLSAGYDAGRSRAAGPGAPLAERRVEALGLRLVDRRARARPLGARAEAVGVAAAALTRMTSTLLVMPWPNATRSEPLPFELSAIRCRGV
jgi:hypothetical protein